MEGERTAEWAKFQNFIYSPLQIQEGRKAQGDGNGMEGGGKEKLTAFP